MKAKILFVDDDANLLSSLRRTLRTHFEFDTALGGAEGLQLIKAQGPYAVVVADMTMPGMDGVTFLEHVRRESPHSVRLMLTGNADQQTAVEAVNRGSIFRFLTKPCPPETLQPALEVALQQYALERTERELLEGTLAGCVKVLTEVLGLTAPEQLGRSQRLRDSMHALAHHIGAGPLWELELAALLSPIGFAALPLTVVRRSSLASDLSPEEIDLIRQVPRIGHDLLVGIPRLGGVARAILYNEKKFDGTGFPHDAVAGAALPLGARLLKILTDRLDLELDGTVKQRAYITMQARTGMYDPDLLKQCFECFPEFLANALSSGSKVYALNLDELQPGQVVVSTITTASGLPLLTAGTRLSGMLIERLRNHAKIAPLHGHIMVQSPDSIPVPESRAV